MSDIMRETFGKYDRNDLFRPAAVSAAEEVACYFRKRYPVMLDGALPRAGDRRTFVRNAQASLASGLGRAMPGAILREALESVSAVGKRDRTVAVKAGLTAVAPRVGRVWWDESVLDNLEDVLVRLDAPRAVLRFYDVTGLDPESGRWNDFFDIDVALERQGQTVNFWAGDRAYVVELGYVHADGRFLRLARTNAVHLPREGKGEADAGEVATSLLKPRAARVDAGVVPDAAAREWAAGRADEIERDIEAELAMRMVYRSFLREGPRALRRAPRLFRRDLEVLGREFARRERERARAFVLTPATKPAAAFLVARLDESVAEPLVVCGRAPALVHSGALSLCGAGVERFGWYAELLSSVRSVTLARALPRLEDAVVRVETENEDIGDLVAEVVDRGVRPSFVSSSVFEAAERLRGSLSGLPAALGGDFEGDDDADAPEAVDESLKVFGGAEAKRMAKAGVRITRMALTLEGRMRPGARLKVAGKLVHADADGRFRLECVLSGRRASIPMRAGASIGGEARSLINVEWEKRASREKKKIW